MQKIITLDFFLQVKVFQKLLRTSGRVKLSCRKRSINKDNYREEYKTRISYPRQTIR